MLIPRPETEELVAWILKDANPNQPLKILDIGSRQNFKTRSQAPVLVHASGHYSITGLLAGKVGSIGIYGLLDFKIPRLNICLEPLLCHQKCGNDFERYSY